MKIKYQITKDDYLEFNMYHLENSPSVKKELRVHKYIIPLLLIAAAAAFSLLTGMPLVITFPIFLIFAVLWSISYPKFYKQNAMKNVSRVLDHGVQSQGAPRYVLNLKEDGVYATSGAGQTFNKWSDIIKFEETDSHIFLYVTEKLAHVVPKRAFKTAEEKNEFLNIIKSNTNF